MSNSNNNNSNSNNVNTSNLSAFKAISNDVFSIVLEFLPFYFHDALLVCNKFLYSQLQEVSHSICKSAIHYPYETPEPFAKTWVQLRKKFVSNFNVSKKYYNHTYPQNEVEQKAVNEWQYSRINSYDDNWKNYKIYTPFKPYAGVSYAFSVRIDKLDKKTGNSWKIVIGVNDISKSQEAKAVFVNETNGYAMIYWCKGSAHCSVSDTPYCTGTYTDDDYFQAPVTVDCVLSYHAIEPAKESSISSVPPSLPTTVDINAKCKGTISFSVNGKPLGEAHGDIPSSVTMCPNIALAGDHSVVISMKHLTTLAEASKLEKEEADMHLVNKAMSKSSSASTSGKQQQKKKKYKK